MKKLVSLFLALCMMCGTMVGVLAEELQVSAEEWLLNGPKVNVGLDGIGFTIPDFEDAEVSFADDYRFIYKVRGVDIAISAKAWTDAEVQWIHQFVKEAAAMGMEMDFQQLAFANAAYVVGTMTQDVSIYTALDMAPLDIGMLNQEVVWGNESLYDTDSIVLYAQTYRGWTYNTYSVLVQDVDGTISKDALVQLARQIMQSVAYITDDSNMELVVDGTVE